MELKLAVAKSDLECSDELAPEDTAKHFDGKEEGMAAGNPALVVQGGAARGNHAVDVGKVLQALIPGVQHAEETDVGTQMTGIAGDLQQSFSARVKQQVVNQPLVLQRQWREFAWQGEHNVHVWRRQQFSFAGLQPAHMRVSLWAMPVSAGNGELTITCFMGSFF